VLIVLGPTRRARTTVARRIRTLSRVCAGLDLVAECHSAMCSRARSSALERHSRKHLGVTSAMIRIRISFAAPSRPSGALGVAELVRVQVLEPAASPRRLSMRRIPFALERAFAFLGEPEPSEIGRADPSLGPKVSPRASAVSGPKGRARPARPLLALLCLGPPATGCSGRRV